MRTLKTLLIASAVVGAGITTNAQVVSTPAPPIVIGLPAGATYPQVVSSNPTNGSKGVTPGSRQIIINFDQPMNTATFYWQAPANLPLTQTPYWTNGNKTFTIPVQLQNNTTYQIPLNASDQAFKSAQGVPLPSGYITFTTGQGGVVAPRTRRGGVPTPAGGVNMPSAGGTFNNVPTNNPGIRSGTSAARPAGAPKQPQQTPTFGSPSGPTNTPGPQFKGSSSVRSRSATPTPRPQ
ncbi:MAG: Ig-like domain-containing protein [Candidatus Sumerlaeaceae bacterium]